MNYKNEYKKEVGSMTLSAEFKEDLKKKCLEEIGKTDLKSEAKVIDIDDGRADIYAKLKVYKYVSMAACLLAVISTIGVFSIMGNQFKTKSANNTSVLTSDNVEMEESVDCEAPDPGTDQDDVLMSPYGLTDGLYDAEDITPVGSDFEEDAPVENEEVLPESAALDASDDDDSFDESLLAKVSDYTGEYVTTDYILGLQNSSNNRVSNVYSDSSAISKESGESNPIDEPSYKKSLNFYDVLAGGLKDESDLLGTTLVKFTVDGIDSEEGIYTAYNVRINYDYLNQTSCSIPAKVWIKGNSEHQIEGMPMYGRGDIVITSLMANPDGSVSVLDEMLYDVYDLSGTDIAYHRCYSNVNPGFTDMGLLGAEREFVTTAENNPVKYVHKSSTRELTRYIRRKIVAEDYNFADLKTLGRISTGEEPFELPDRTPDEPDVPETPENPEDPENPDDENQPQGEEQPQEELVSKLRVITSDERLVITSANNVIALHDPQTSEYLSSRFKNSTSGTTGSSDKSNAMFVGGKLIFNSSNAFGGELIGIEISGAGCPLDIGVNGAKVGDSLEQVKELLGITKNLASNSKVTYQGNTITVVLTFQYDALVKIEIS